MTTVEMERVAKRILESGLQELTTVSVARLRHDEKGYETINLSDLREQMERTLSLALMRLAGMPIPAELSSAAYETGQLRAYQNLELSSVLHSFRIDLRILWEAILREGNLQGLGGNSGFLAGLLDVWEAVEANIADVVEGYRRAADRVTRRTEELRSAAFERLLSDGDHDQSIVSEAFKTLGLPLDGNYLCLVGLFPSPEPDELNRTLARLNQRNIPSYFAWVPGELLGVVSTGTSAKETVQHLDDLQRFTCGVFQVSGLRSVPRGIRLARAAMRGASQPGIRDLRHSWTAAFTSADSELSESLVTSVLEPLNLLPTQERQGCFETVAAYVESDGSIASIAAITYRHRNTIRKRLQQIEEATALDLSRPKDIATLCLAYDAFTRQSRSSARSKS